MIDQAFAALRVSFSMNLANITTASESAIHRRPFAGEVPAIARRSRWSIRHRDT